MWKGVTASSGPCGAGVIAGMAVGFQWRSWAARVYRAAVMMWWAWPSRTMWRSVPKSSPRRLKLHGQNHTKCTQIGPCKKMVFHRLCFFKTEY